MYYIGLRLELIVKIIKRQYYFISVKLTILELLFI